MEISSLTVKLIILLIPGLISYFIYKRITKRQSKRSDFMFASISVLLGILSYVLLQFINNLTCILGYEGLITFESLSESNSSIPYTEVIGASICGIIIAYIFTYVDSYNIVNNFARLIRASHKYNDENLFSIFLSDRKFVDVYVRDIKNKLTYAGKIKYFSEKESEKELILIDVIVYSYPESNFLYDLSSIYLSFTNENMIIEQAKLD